MSTSTRKTFSLTGDDGLARTRGTYRVADPSAFCLTGTSWSFGDVGLLDQTHTPAVIPDASGIVEIGKAADRALIYVSVVFIRDGGYSVRYRGHTLRLLPNSSVFLAERAPIEAETVRDTHITTVSVPLARLSSHGAELTAPFGAFRFSLEQPDPLWPFVFRLIETVDVLSVPSEPIATVLAELTARLFVADRIEPGSAAVSLSMLRSRLDAVIIERAADPTFTPHMLASKVDLPVRRVDDVFLNTGTGADMAEMIRSWRLVLATLAARELFVDGTAATIHDVARQAGFASVRDLDHASVKRYGAPLLEMVHPV